MTGSKTPEEGKSVPDMLARLFKEKSPLGKDVLIDLLRHIIEMHYDSIIDLDKCDGPQQSVQPGETVHKKAPSDSIRLFYVVLFSRNEAEIAKIDEGNEFSSSEHNVSKYFYQILDLILRYTIREEFDLWTSKRVGIREGWKIISVQ